MITTITLTIYRAPLRTVYFFFIAMIYYCFQYIQIILPYIQYLPNFSQCKICPTLFSCPHHCCLNMFVHKIIQTSFSSAIAQYILNFKLMRIIVSILEVNGYLFLIYTLPTMSHFGVNQFPIIFHMLYQIEYSRVLLHNFNYIIGYNIVVSANAVCVFHVMLRVCHISKSFFPPFISLIFFNMCY